MNRSLCAVVAFASIVSSTALADVQNSAADNFVIEHRYVITVTPDAAWQALLQPGRWWPADHTWSGAAANLSLDADAGGCFCERWAGGAVEHGRVVMSRPGSLLRMRGSLGPLQEMAVTGVLTIALQAGETGTVAIVTYRVSGDSSHALDKLAPVVDQVLGMQFGNFATFASQASRQ